MDGYITFKVFQKQSNQSLKEAIQERDKSINRDSPQFYQINLSQYLIDMGAILANYLGAYGPLSVYIPINQVINSSYLEISSFALDSDIFYKILSTFKFVEQGNAFCGGIAGTLCPSGYTCQLEGNYPDASGKCIPLR